MQLKNYSEAHDLVEVVNTIKTAIDKACSEYELDLGTISTSSSNIDFGTWDDEVSAKLKSNIENDIKGDLLTTINTDLTSGGMPQLKQLMTRLCTEIKTLADADTNYTATERKRKNLKEDDPNRPSKSTLDSYGSKRSTAFNNVNTILNDLESVTFGKAITLNDMQDAPITISPISESPYQNSALDREDVEYGNSKKITIQMAGDDSPVGNMYWTQYGSPVNKTKNIQVIPGEDGKYYEYVTYVETDSWTGEEVFRETTRRELAGDPTTITFTTTNADGQVVGETTVSVFLDSELGQLGYNQLLIDSGIDGGLYLSSTFGDGATVNLPNGKTVTVKSEGGSGEWHQPRNGQVIDRNDPTLTVVTPGADGTLH